MANKTNSGFTIIETLLYLGVSSALVVAILVGVGSSVTQQRYSDSVDSLKSYIQEQYGRVANTVNGRSGLESCRESSGGIALNNDAGAAAQKPGMSECVIIGRYIEVDDYGVDATQYGQALLVSNVIAHPYKNSSCTGPISNDIEDLRCNYVIQRGTVERDRYDIAWGNKLVTESDRNEYKQFSMMIVRSPRSGAIMTLISPDTKISTSGLSGFSNSTSRTLNLCVDGDSGVGGGSLRAVRIVPFAASASAVQIPNESESVCAL